MDRTIVDDTNYRNILIIITDGYIYHEDSKIKDKNRTSYLLPNVIKANGLRGNNNWKQKFDEGNYGFIVSRSDLEKLEVLVLEINTTIKDYEDIIKAYLSKWFEEMGIKKYKIYNNELDLDNTKDRIKEFVGV